MNVFWPFWLWGNNTLDEVNEFLDERRLNEESTPLTLDSTSLIRTFKEKIKLIQLNYYWSLGIKLACIWNAKGNGSYYHKQPKIEWPEHKVYMFF